MRRVAKIARRHDKAVPIRTKRGSVFATDIDNVPKMSDDGLDTVPDGAPRAETRLVAQGEARRMADCFAALEPDRADAVKGAYLNGLSYLDLAARHAVPLNTMRTWLRRSLLKLKECLET